MSKQPPILRTLTVCEGRNTIGFIQERWDHQFSAEGIDGKIAGLFPTTGEAAQAIKAAKRNATANKGEF